MPEPRRSKPAGTENQNAHADRRRTRAMPASAHGAAPSVCRSLGASAWPQYSQTPHRRPRPCPANPDADRRRPLTRRSRYGGVSGPVHQFVTIRPAIAATRPRRTATPLNHRLSCSCAGTLSGAISPRRIYTRMVTRWHVVSFAEKSGRRMSACDCKQHRLIRFIYN